MRRTSSSIILLVVVVAGCRTASEDESLPQVEGYVADAKASTGDGGPEAPGESLTEFEAKLLTIRDAWEKRLGAPETLFAFYDFTSPEMTKLREEAAAEGFAGTLAEEVTLEQLLAGAFVRNPDLRAASKQLKGTVEQYAQVTYLDTILRQYVSFLRTLDTRIGPTVPMDQVQKRFPFPGTLELKAAIVGHAVEAARAQYEAALRDLVTDVRVAYADYIYLAQAILLTRETLGYLGQLEAEVRGKLGAGLAQKSHVLQTQVEMSKLENDLITLHQGRETVRARLNTLLDLPPNATLGEPAKPEMQEYPRDIEPLYARALLEQPDIRFATARAARMATVIELAEQATYPELSAGFSYMEDPSHATMGTGRDREPFSTRPKVKPDPWFGNKEAYLREVRESERAARAKVTAARDTTLFSVKDAYVQLDTADRLFKLYRDVQISQAEQAYSDAMASYRADRLEFLNVIDSLRLYLRFLLDADRARRDFHQSYARLESAIGGPLNRKGK